MATVANRVRVAGPDLETAEEARKRFEAGLVPGVQAPNPTRSVDGIEPTVDFETAPESLDNTPEPVPEPTPKALFLPNWSKRLDEARARGDDLRRGASIQRAGEGINGVFMQAIGLKPSAGVADRMDADAGIPEARVKEDMSLEQAGLKRQKEMEETDVNSATNVNARATFQKDFPALAQSLGDKFKTMTRKSLNDWATSNFKMQQLENSAKSSEARIAQAQAQQDFNQNKFDVDQRNWQTKFEADERFRQEQNAIAWTNATRKAEELAMYGGMSGVDFRKLQTRLDKVSEESKPLSEVTAGLQNIEKMLPGITDGKLNKKYSLTPTDKIVARIPGGTNLLSTEKQQLLKAAEDLKNLVVGARSGLTVTEQEREKYESQFGERTFDDAQILANALLWYKGLIYKKLRDTQAGFAPVGNPAIDKHQPLTWFEQADGAPITYRDEWWTSVGGPGNRLRPGQNPETPAPTNPAPAQTPVPQAANKSAQTAGAGDTVKVRSPAGVIGSIPRANLQKALDAKYTLVEE